MTIKEAADQHIGHPYDSCEGLPITMSRESYKGGAVWAIQKALDVLDNMFMEQGSISVDDWFRDSKNLFQGRESFKKRMDE